MLQHPCFNTHLSTPNTHHLSISFIGAFRPIYVSSRTDLDTTHPMHYKSAKRSDVKSSTSPPWAFSGNNSSNTRSRRIAYASSPSW